MEEWKIISGFKNFSIGCLGVLEDVCRTFYNLNGNDNKLRASKPLYLRSQLKLQSTQEIRNIMRGETTFYNRASIFCIIWPVELHKKVFNFPNLLFYWMLSTNNELSSTFCHLLYNIKLSILCWLIFNMECSLWWIELRCSRALRLQHILKLILQ